jgi:membrane-bound serine protease (ClpP class)
MIVWVCVAVGGLVRIVSAEPATNAADRSAKLVYVVEVHQTIESGLQQFLTRAFEDANQANARYIVLDINTFGGRVDTAEGIGDLIRGSDIPTIAFVRGKAASAGSYIALSADKIVMAPGSSIGAAAVVDAAGREVDNPKIISHWAGEMRAAAEMNGRNPDIAEGMVDKNAVVTMPQLDKTSGKGEIITLTAEEALKVGYADRLADGLDGVLDYIGASGDTVIHFTPTAAEKLAQFLTNQTISTLLLLVGIAGLAIELFVPGFGIPGILGLAGFGLYFFGHYIAGFAGIEDIVLFFVGVILMIVEIFVPGFGVIGLAGIACLIGSVVMAAFNTEQALLSLGIALLAAIVVVIIVARIFKHRGVWNRFILRDEQKNELGYTSAPPRGDLVGKKGRALTPLRPAGTVLIDGARVDAVTEGEFIGKDVLVVVGKVEGVRVVVGQAEGERESQ